MDETTATTAATTSSPPIPDRRPRPGDIVWIRQDRHTDRAAHAAHEAAVLAYEEAVRGRREALDRGDAPATLPALPPEPAPESPAPLSSRPLPAIVFAVADDGATIAAHVFHGARGVAFDSAVPYGGDVPASGEWAWPT